MLDEYKEWVYALVRLAKKSTDPEIVDLMKRMEMYKPELIELAREKPRQKSRAEEASEMPYAWSDPGM